MGICKYCGKEAGLFKSKHQECEDAYNRGKIQLTSLIQQIFVKKEDFYQYDSQIQSIVSASHIDIDAKDALLVDAYDRAVEYYLNDNIISSDEMRVISRYQQYTGLPQALLNSHRSLEKVVQSSILQEVMSGRIPEPRVQVKGQFPFILGKGETMIWVYRDVECLEQRVKRQYVGGSHGMSFHVAKGVYYRVGGFKGTPIEQTVMQSIGIGMVCLTDKQLYFSSSQKSFKIPYSKLIYMEPFANGVGLQKDGSSAKPFFFKGIDSWFIYNLITNLLP